MNLFEFKPKKNYIYKDFNPMQPSPNGKSNNEPDAILTFLKWYFYPKYGKMDTAISFKISMCALVWSLKDAF